MTRIFITINPTKLKGMFQDTPLARFIDSYIDSHNQLPKTPHYKFDNVEIIVLSDEFQDWAEYNIDKKNDGILYHTSSKEEVVKLIQHTFTHIEKSNHNQSSLFFEVFEIIHDDENDKGNRIVQRLFSPIAVNEAPESDFEAPLTLQIARENYQKLHRSLTYGLIKEKVGVNFEDDLKNSKAAAKIVSQYWKGRLTQLDKTNTLNEIYDILVDIQKEIAEAYIFEIPLKKSK